MLDSILGIVLMTVGWIVFWALFMLFLHGWGKETSAVSAQTKPAAKPITKPTPKASAVGAKPLGVPVAAAPAPTASEDSNDPLERVRARAANIDFARIGTASAANKDDLKQIKGIGPFIEEKLNALGIYRFEQIAKFTSDDETKVNEAIEFFSGRIKRDDWVMQARKLQA